MSRTYKALLLATAGLALSLGTASGQVVTTAEVSQPRSNADPAVEVTGLSTVIKIAIPGNLDADAGFTDGAPLKAAIRGVDANNNPVTAYLNIPGGNFAATNGGDYDDTAGNECLVTLSPSIVGLSGIFNTVGVVAIQVALNTGALDFLANAVVTNADFGNEATDECLAIDTTAPSISQAFINSGGTGLFVVYTEAMNNGSGDGAGLGNFGENGDNHTVLANVSATDFQFNTANLFDNATGNPPLPFAVNGAFLDAPANTTVNVDITGNATIVAGTFIRSAADDAGAPVAANDLRDVVGNKARQSGTGGVQITTVPALAITSITWVDQVPSGLNGTVTDAIRVTFNLPLDGAGDNDFYGGASSALTHGASTDSDLDIDVAGIDPNDANSVLIDVIGAVSNDGVGPDGLLESALGNSVLGTFSMTTVLSGTRPSSIFDASATEYAAAQTLPIADGIAPQLAFRSFHDLNFDGEQDAVAFVFNEPMTTSTSIANYTVAINNGATVRPFHQIDADGNLVTDTTAAGAVALTGVTIGSVDVDNNGEISPIEVDNTIFLNFSPRANNWDGVGGTTGTDDDAIPGTGDANVMQSSWDGNGAITDANGNAFPATLPAANVGTDRARPIASRFCFFTGDNQPNGFNNDQSFFEQDGLNIGNLGDQNDNNRLGMFFSEPLNAIPNTGALDENTIQFGNSGATFNNNDFLFQSPNNAVTLGFIDGATQAVSNQFGIGVNVTLAPLNNTQNIRDAAGNNARANAQTVADCVALYAAHVSDVNNDVAFGAFLIDANANGFVDQIRIRMTKPVDATTVAASDFSIDFGGTITAAAVDSGDPNTIVLTVTDNVVSVNNTVTLTYNGATDANRIASTTTGGGNGLAVSALNDSASISKIAEPVTNTRDVAIMPLVGTITTNGTTPAPFGTKVFAMIAVPSVNSVTATHNNTEFTIRRGDRHSGLTHSSFEAWTSWWLQIERDIYLHRTSDNVQIYDNTKFLDEDNDGNTESSFVRDGIRLTVNASSITNVTFTGTGETSSERVTNGRVGFCWDVLRSRDGTLISLFDRGYSLGGQPILSSAVVTNSTGAYEMHVSAPLAAFTGRTRFNAVGWPVILVIELPNGQRFAASSIATSVNGGPLLFQANNRIQTGTNANNAVSFNVNLNNIGAQTVWPEWNTVAYPRAGGFARAASNVPVLPSGVVSANVRVGSALPFVDPADQFVWWNDNNSDGAWTIDDDSSSASPFDSVIVDADAFPNFAFTMTSFGVQVGTGITNLVGGYGLGFFNATYSTLGAFQFGAPLNSASVFGPTFFPNSSTTQGWTLATVSQAFSPATGFGPANTRSDYIIVFDNNGPAGIQVRSLSIANPGGSNNPNDLTSIPAGTAAFIHYTN